MTTCKAILGCVLLPSLLGCAAPAEAEERGYPAGSEDRGAYVAPVYGCVPDAFKVISRNGDATSGYGLYVVWNPVTGVFAESTSDAPCPERLGVCREALDRDEGLD